VVRRQNKSATFQLKSKNSISNHSSLALAFYQTLLPFLNIGSDYYQPTAHTTESINLPSSNIITHFKNLRSILYSGDHYGRESNGCFTTAKLSPKPCLRLSPHTAPQAVLGKLLRFAQLFFKMI